MIFVFGSNLSGRHGAGAARTARIEHGAVYGVAEGLTGNSYALPTCGHQFEPLPLETIEWSVRRFAAYVNDHPNTQFQVTRVGCGLGRYTDADIAPMFWGAPYNCHFDEKWKPWLLDRVHYWGTF
jgi:hypothetical protein